MQRGDSKAYQAQGCHYAEGYIIPLAMSDHDLELGLLPSESSSRKGSRDLGNVSPVESSWHPLESSRLEKDDRRSPNVYVGASIARTALAVESKEKHDESQYEYIAGVPRKKVEQLMKLWLDVLHDSLTAKQGQADTRQTGELTQEDVHLERNSRSSPNSIHRHRPKAVKVDVRTPQPEGWLSIRERDQAIWHNVHVWSESEIIAEDERRRAVRPDWRPSEGDSDLEDCWEHLWQPKPGVDKGLFQWACSEDRRKRLQLDLADALNANDSIVVVGLYMRRDFRAIAPWISLIGLRLNELYRTIYQGAGISPMTQIEILIECLWCCNWFRTKLGDKRNNQSPRIGDVLSACYRRRVLEEPVRSPILDGIVLREHYQYVRTALYLVTILYKHKIPTFHRSESLDSTWDTSLSTAEAAMRERPNVSELESSKDSFFRVDDFNVRDLQSLGHLQIQWTSYWDEHLKLETSSTANILKVYWFQPSLAQFLVQK